MRLSKDVRERIASRLDEKMTVEEVDSFIDAMLNAEKVIYPVIVCTNCGHDFKPPVEVADIKTRAQVLQILADQGKGRPPEQKTIDVNVNATLGSLQSLSDEELGWIVESEAKELEGPS